MRFCSTFCPLSKENFSKGTLTKDASDHVFVLCEEDFALFYTELTIKYK